MTYTTRDEAIYREIIQPIEATGIVKAADEEYDIDKIADKVIAEEGGKYEITVTDDEFWAAVEEAAL